MACDGDVNILKHKTNKKSTKLGKNDACSGRKMGVVNKIAPIDWSIFIFVQVIW